MKPSTKLRILHQALILGLVLTFFLNPQVYSAENDEETGTESTVANEKEDLPSATIAGVPEGTIFQDLFADLQELMVESGYKMAEALEPPDSNIVFSWTISSDDSREEWFAEELILTDYTAEDTPLEDREISAMYMASTTEDEENFLEIDSSLAEAFGIPPADLLATAAEDIEDWGALIEIEGTGSTLEYYYTLAPHYSVSPVATNQHTLSAEIKPIGYEEESLLEALPKLADYLYEVRPGWADGFEQYYVRAMITEEELEVEGVNYHSLELIHSSYTDTVFVRHYIDFEDNVSLEDSLEVIAYLEERLPEDITGLQTNWEQTFEEGEYLQPTGDGWSAGISATSINKMMWVFYRLEP